MLDIFRKRGLSSLIYGAIIVATVFVFVIQFRPNATQKTGSLGETCAARVRGYCIEPKELRADQLMITPRDESGQMSDSPTFRKFALDGLIERELLIAEADKIGLTVTDDEVTTLITEGYIYFSAPYESVPQYRSLRLPAEGRHSVGKAYQDPKTKSFSEAEYAKKVQRFTGLRPVDFHAWQAREILAAKIRALVSEPIRIGEGEAIAAYENEKSSATLTYAEFKAGYFGKYAVSLSDADVEAWLKESDNAKTIDSVMEARKGSHAPQEKHLRHILAKYFDGNSPREPTAEERAKALGKISEAWARLKKGEAFADVARAMSEDSSASTGGDLGDSTDNFVPAFKKAADALKPGEITPGVVETEFGYHIIERDDPAKASEIEALLRKGAARELATKAKGFELAKEAAAKVLALMKGGKDGDASVQEVMAGVFGGKKALPPPPIPPVIPMPGKEAETADAGTVDAGGKKPAGDAGGAPGTPRAIFPSPDKDKERPQFQSTNPFNRGGDPIASLSGTENAKVLKFAFDAKDGDTYPDPLPTLDSVVVARLASHKAATPEEFQKERDVYLSTILPTKQLESMSLYTKRLREKSAAEIRIDQSVSRIPDGGAAPAPEEEEAP